LDFTCTPRPPARASTPQARFSLSSTRFLHLRHSCICRRSASYCEPGASAAQISPTANNLMSTLPLQLQLFPALTAPVLHRVVLLLLPRAASARSSQHRGTCPAASRARAAPSPPLPHPHRRPRSAPPSGPRAPTIYPPHPSRQAPGARRARLSCFARRGQEFVPAPMRRHAKGRALGMRVDRDCWFRARRRRR